jgi:hypothetical protein
LELARLVSEDREMTVWWVTEVECVSALARLSRDEQIHP